MNPNCFSRAFAKRSSLIAGALLSLLANPVFAQERSDTLVITSANEPQSQAVAAKFCEAFEVPKSNILALDFPKQDTLRRTEWEDELRPKVAAWLEANDPNKTIANIVTTYGTPLAVSAWEDDRERKPWREFYQAALSDRIKQINFSLGRLSKLARKNSDAKSVDGETPAADIRKQFERSIGSAQKTVSTLKVQELESATATLQAQIRGVLGVYPFIESLQKQANSGSTTAAKAKLQYQFATGRIDSINETIEMLRQTPASFERDSIIIQLLEQQGGVLSSVDWIQQQIKMIDDNDSMASLDSELALVLWPEYRRLGTTPNLLHPAFANSPLKSKLRTLSVTRIDGPTPDAALALIDRALEATKVEQPTGKVYVDLRAVVENDRVAKQQERWLKSVANQFKSVDGVELVVEETAKMFPADGCPDTLLYCGWYSLGKYIDSFTFKPGAIAYHLTPGDALGIHQQDKQGWCKNMIEKGATVVVGSVTEPEIVGIGSLDFGSKRVQPLTTSSGMIIFGCDLGPASSGQLRAEPASE